MTVYFEKNAESAPIDISVSIETYHVGIYMEYYVEMCMKLDTKRFHSKLEVSKKYHAR